MALKTKPPKFADDEVVICHMSFAAGEDVAVQGERYRGDHPLVRKFPGNFVADGTPRSEWPSMWEGMPEPNNELRFQTTPIPDEEAAVCVTAFSVGMRSFGKGQRVRRDDPVVQANKELFRTPMMPLE